jgi:hypothetical protein
VAEHHVAAEPVAQPQRQLQVDARASGKLAEGRASQRFGDDVGAEAPAVDLAGRQTRSADGDRVAGLELAGDRRGDLDHHAALVAFDADHLTHRLDQTGEHHHSRSRAEISRSSPTRSQSSVRALIA